MTDELNGGTPHGDPLGSASCPISLPGRLRGGGVEMVGFLHEAVRSSWDAVLETVPDGGTESRRS